MSLHHENSIWQARRSMKLSPIGPGAVFLQVLHSIDLYTYERPSLSGPFPRPRRERRTLTPHIDQPGETFTRRDPLPLNELLTSFVSPASEPFDHLSPPRTHPLSAVASSSGLRTEKVCQVCPLNEHKGGRPGCTARTTNMNRLHSFVAAASFHALSPVVSRKTRAGA